MANKKKTETIGTIKGIDVLRQTKPIQDIPFRTGVYTDKRKKREKVNKRNMDKWMWTLVRICAPGRRLLII